MRPSVTITNAPERKKVSKINTKIFTLSASFGLELIQDLEDLPEVKEVRLSSGREIWVTRHTQDNRDNVAWDDTVQPKVIQAICNHFGWDPRNVSFL